MLFVSDQSTPCAVSRFQSCSERAVWGRAGGAVGLSVSVQSWCQAGLHILHPCSHCWPGSSKSSGSSHKAPVIQTHWRYINLIKFFLIVHPKMLKYFWYCLLKLNIKIPLSLYIIYIYIIYMYVCVCVCIIYIYIYIFKWILLFSKEHLIDQKSKVTFIMLKKMEKCIFFSRKILSSTSVFNIDNNK